MQTDLRDPSPAAAGGGHAPPGWRWLLVRVIAASVVLAVVSVVGVVALVRSQHPRDEQTFLYYVGYSSSTNGEWDLEGVDERFVVAEGDRACRWLQDQPYALYRRGGRWAHPAVLARYLHEAGAPAEQWTRGPRAPGFYRQVIAGQAWANLCGADWELRETHNPFNRPPSD